MAIRRTAESPGVAAPILLLVCRLLQGFARGGEVGPSTAFLIEAAPPHRRGFYGCFGATIVNGVGNVLGPDRAQAGDVGV